MERGQAAEDRVLSRHLAEANRDEEERRIQGKGKGRNMLEDKKGGEIARSMGEETGSSNHDVTALKEMIVAAAVEQIDHEETMTQATVTEMTIVAVSDGMMTKTTDEVAGVRNDEQMLLEQLLQGNEMGGNCEEQEHVEEKHERDEMQDEVMQGKGGGRLWSANPKKGKWWRLGKKAVLCHMRKVPGKWNSRTLWCQSRRRNQGNVSRCRERAWAFFLKRRHWQLRWLLIRPR